MPTVADHNRRPVRPHPIGPALAFPVVDDVTRDAFDHVITLRQRDGSSLRVHLADVERTASDPATDDDTRDTWARVARDARAILARKADDEARANRKGKFLHAADDTRTGHRWTLTGAPGVRLPAGVDRDTRAAHLVAADVRDVIARGYRVRILTPDAPGAAHLIEAGSEG